MNVIVKARHMTLTHALKTHATEKLGLALSKLLNNPAARMEIELIDHGHTKDKNNQECRITLFIPKSKTVVISEIDDDMYKAIDLAHDRLLEQVKREHGRKLTKMRKTAALCRYKNYKTLLASA